LSDNAINEIIAAFAAGCIDKANYVQFKDYLRSGGEIPEDELGEFQNIVSMIPIILDFETPPPSLKDEVAKKLIGMQEEIKTKIREERKKTIFDKSSTFTKFDQISEQTKTTLNFIDSQKKSKIKEENTLEEKSKTRFTGSIIPEKPQTLFTQPTPQQPESPKIQDKEGSGFIGWIALLLSIVLFSLIGYYTYTSIADLNGELEDLKQSSASFKNELATANYFMNNYISLIEFFNYRDVAIVNLRSDVPQENATARLFLAFDQKEGLIQFRDMKPLQPNQGYQIWLVSRGQSYSMGVYKPAGREYLRITTFPYIPKDQIELVKITIESDTGSPTPSVINYLTGNVLK